MLNTINNILFYDIFLNTASLCMRRHNKILYYCSFRQQKLNTKLDDIIFRTRGVLCEIHYENRI